METEKEKYTRREIRAIQQNTTLTQQERVRAIQQLMMHNHNLSSNTTTTSSSPRVIIQTHGCTHYRRHCQIKAPCCGQFFSCRHCHDEEITGHRINRFEIKEMQCSYCSTVQPISNKCIACDKEMAHYFCDICHLFDDDSEKNLWHCMHCGYCIKTPVNKSYAHCFECNTCRDKDHIEYVITG